MIGNWANGGARKMELEMSSSALVPDSPPIGALKQEYRSIHEYSTTPPHRHRVSVWSGRGLRKLIRQRAIYCHTTKYSHLIQSAARVNVRNDATSPTVP